MSNRTPSFTETKPPKIESKSYRKQMGIDHGQSYDLTDMGLIAALALAPTDGDPDYPKWEALINWAWAAEEAIARLTGYRPGFIDTEEAFETYADEMLRDD